jgi:hypothetical protein
MHEDTPQRDWTEGAETRLDEAEAAGDDERLALLEEINERLEAELDLNRPHPGGTAERASEGGETRPPGR